ncbi:HTH_Tnp_Tc3_2 domain-containing protein [Trichonephila clavipes]|nr:HTH_Tnp_Tc3_2 domain-containing protein [Trichonephila clavipes]
MVGKSGDCVNCKGQLALTMRGERRLRRIASRTVSKRSVQLSLHHMVSGAVSLREYHCSMLAIGLHVLPEQECTDWMVEVWSDESRFRLLNADWRVRIGSQAHEAMDPACQVGTIQRHGGSIII